MSRLKIPGSVYSALGSVPVAVDPELDPSGGTLGLTEFDTRRIRLSPKLSPESLVQTLWHEVTHVALSDAGLNFVLKPTHIEAVCVKRSGPTWQRLRSKAT